MNALKKYGLNLLILAILAGMIVVRVTAYGDFRLSIGNADTTSYMEGAAAPIISKDMLTKGRLFTTNLFYYLADVQGCKLHAMSYPALGAETYREIQPCFDRIVLFQNVLSIFAWSILALVLSKRLTGGYEKILGVSLVAAFGFTPAIADWDSVLSSESLTFSLFAICVALIMEVCFNIAADEKNKKYSTFILSLAILTLALWAFTRDANIYTLAVLFAVSIVSVLLFPVIRKNKNLLILIAAVFIITVVGMQSAMISKRWEAPMANVFHDLILPHPARVEFMKQSGMPDPTSAAYSTWFSKSAPRAYARFLLFHPGYTLTSFTAELGGIFYENSQPYFFSDQTSARKALAVANDILHPGTYLIFILDILLIAALIVAAFRRKNKDFTVWVWLGAWLFLSALVTIAVGFFADSVGVTRHTMFAVEMFRLLMWMFLIILFDQTNRKNEEVDGNF